MAPASMRGRVGSERESLRDDSRLSKGSGDVDVVAGHVSLFPMAKKLVKKTPSGPSTGTPPPPPEGRDVAPRMRFASKATGGAGSEPSTKADPAGSEDPSASKKWSVELYTDGACTGNPGPGGWGYILRDPDTGKEKEGSGGDPQTTNNRMELLSVIEGLRALRKPATVRLVSDSQYVVKGLQEWLKGWKARGWRKADKSPVLNRELWEELDRLAAVHDLRPEWIRGHQGHHFNERCDRLAVAAIAQVRRT